MKNYQVVLKTGSQTLTHELESYSHNVCRDILNKYCVGEVTDIREVLHTDNSTVIDDGNYIHSKTIKISNEHGLNSIRIPKFSKTIDDKVLSSLVQETFLIGDKTPKKLEIKATHK